MGLKNFKAYYENVIFKVSKMQAKTSFCNKIFVFFNPNIFGEFFHKGKLTILDQNKISDLWKEIIKKIWPGKVGYILVPNTEIRKQRLTVYKM